LKKERVSLRSVIDTALESSRPLIERARHKLSLSAPDEPIYFDVDPTRMVQVVGNLLNNAAKYTTDCGHIVLRARAEGRDVVIEVSDDGAGIPEEQFGAVFEMFSQVNRTLERAQGGLGIGLAVVRKLLEMHGGTIAVKSKGMGMGSTFTVRLPNARKTEETMASKTESATRNSPKRILVVDDNRDAAECLSMLLEISGHSTQMAHTGPDALATATEFHPEVVFLDIGLPGMDGYEVARRLRHDPEFAASTLIAVTGWGSEEDRRRSTEAGFDFHLTKPVESSTVENLLARASSH
jgi:CheY-like chemotaxis protein